MQLNISRTALHIIICSLHKSLSRLHDGMISYKIDLCEFHRQKNGKSISLKNRRKDEAHCFHELIIAFCVGTRDATIRRLVSKKSQTLRTTSSGKGVRAKKRNSFEKKFK
ncbi:hypothetical protein Tcan_17685 [Toxocara canis]|uniref:Uncharacterized protein n=1 Tax=Toxocara canis TaxID=6265 RepID=A0A0B2UU82_TOXCA|nr:hypothetical protein Tcan_17685 [Toxocara canis]